MNIWDGKLYHSRQGTGGCVCSNLFPLVLVEDDWCEEKDGVTEKPQEASLDKTQRRLHTWALHQQRGGSSVEGVLVRAAAYFGEAEVEVPLQSAPFSGDDLVKDRGQQEGQQDSERHEEESSQTLLWVVAVMLTLRLGILLP